MRVRARIDKNLDTVEILVCSNELTPQVKALVEDISAFVNEGISGTDFRGEKVMVPLRDILRFYATGETSFDVAETLEVMKIRAAGLAARDQEACIEL